MLVLLLCFIYIAYSCASEELTPLIKNTQDSELLNQVKASYDSQARHPYKVCKTDIIETIFYDPIKNETCSFQSTNPAIESLFQKDQDMSILDILSSNDMQAFIYDNKLHTEFFDQYIAFFKQVKNWYNYAWIGKTIWHERWIYTLHHFLYTVTSAKNASNQQNIYNHFFRCFQKEASDLYNDITNSQKIMLLTGNVCGGCLSALFTWFLALETNFTLSIQEDFASKVLFTGAIIMPATTFSITTTCYFRNYFGYKKFLKNIQNINQTGDAIV